MNSDYLTAIPLDIEYSRKFHPALSQSIAIPGGSSVVFFKP